MRTFTRHEPLTDAEFYRLGDFLCVLSSVHVWAFVSAVLSDARKARAAASK